MSTEQKSRRLFVLGGIAAGTIALTLGGLGWRRTSPHTSSNADHGFPLTLSESQWRQWLSPEQFAVLRKHKTEAAGSSPLDAEEREGFYHCAGCGQAVFHSSTKYDSGTGWPSFHTALQDAIATAQDTTLVYMVRTEVHCKHCGGHLGHVFDDGPKPTGKRYCINGLALYFSPT